MVLRPLLMLICFAALLLLFWLQAVSTAVIRVVALVVEVLDALCYAALRY